MQCVTYYRHKRYNCAVVHLPVMTHIRMISQVSQISIYCYIRIMIEWMREWFWTQPQTHSLFTGVFIYFCLIRSLLKAGPVWEHTALFCWSCWWKNLWNLNVSDKQTHSTVVDRFALNKTKPQVSEVKLHFDAPSQWTSHGANFFFHRRTIHSCQSQQAHIYKLKVRRVQQWSVHMGGCLILSFFPLEPWQTLSLQ